jgi:hypothetical protein
MPLRGVLMPRRYNVLVNPEKLRQRNADIDPWRYDLSEQIKIVDNISENYDADVEFITRGASRNVYAPTAERPGKLEDSVLKVSRYGVDGDWRVKYMGNGLFSKPSKVDGSPPSETGFYEDTVSAILEEAGLKDMIVPAIPAGPGAVIQERIERNELLDPLSMWDYVEEISDSDEYQEYLGVEKMLEDAKGVGYVDLGFNKSAEYRDAVAAVELDYRAAMREWKRSMEQRMIGAGFPEEVAKNWIKSQDVHVGNFAKTPSNAIIQKPRLIDDQWIMNQVEVPKLRILDYDTGKESPSLPGGLKRIRSYSRSRIEPNSSTRRRVRTINGKKYIARRQQSAITKKQAQEHARFLRNYGLQVRTLPLKTKWVNYVHAPVANR